MARITVLSVVLALLAACTTTEQARVDTTAGIQPYGLSPSGAPLGRDNPAATYTQPVVGPERRVEPPPAPRRP
jgi:hypothetical protein